MKKCVLLFFVSILFFNNTSLWAQSEYAQKVVQELCSEKYWGRGYTKNGMQNAAQYIAEQMNVIGLEGFENGSFHQYFTLSSNTFPGKMELSINGKTLKAGKDFIINAHSKGLKGKYELLASTENGVYFNDELNIVVQSGQKLVWSPAPSVENGTHIIVKDSIKSNKIVINTHIEQTFIPDFKTSNVGGIVRGTAVPDSFLVITAHYDHLGGMGNKVYFPGANDNASGIALMLDLAKYYAKNPARYSIVFIAFSAEEIGLLGSKNYVEHANIDLKKIKFLLNLDLMGNGEEGITIVNASGHKDAFNAIEAANSSQQWFVKVNARDNAANSDHYPFTQKGVPAFFIYTLGGNQAYHDVYDVPETLPLKYFPQLIELVKVFFKQL